MRASGTGWSWAGAALLAGALLGSVLAVPVRAEEVSGGESTLIRTLLPSVVNITSRKVESDTPDPRTAAAASGGSRVLALSGSGFVIDPSGIIATNAHVIDGAYEINVTTADGKCAPARILAEARYVDIALLKVDMGHPLPALRWGDSNQVHVGDPVIAIGNPLGIGMSVSAGIVSALHRDLHISPYDDFLQTDASINHGNSGGPLFNTQGEVVGIDAALYSPTTGSVGLGFAIPSDSARWVIRQLLRYGWVRPGWLGAEVQDVTPEMAEALGLPRAEGGIVIAIQPDSPAARAGLRVGDVILRFGADEPGDSRALMRDISIAELGKETTLTVWRGGAAQPVPVIVMEWPKAEVLARDAPVPATKPKWIVPPDLGLGLAPLTDEERAKAGLPTGETGVVIAVVAPRTDAADRGLAPGEVILQVQDRTVASPADVRQALDAARAQHRDFAILLVSSRHQRRWVAVRISTEPPPA